eukprot:Tamp_32978.p1 GENE.Tamp_32978~~Tamp_32978.p1  ORF type:complete len:192 (+),score=30.35 Tamp_32978:55-576(+)
MSGMVVACGVSFLTGLWAARMLGLGAGRVGAYGEPDSEHAAPLFAPKLRNDFGISDGPGKMILVVNNELKMGKGKIGAQCGHAVLGAYKRCRKFAPSALQWWEQLGQKKVCVNCPTGVEMEEIEKRAVAKGLVTYFVTDAGRTQIPAGSRTVLAIGPAPEKEFEGLTSHLKLL